MTVRNPVLHPACVMLWLCGHVAAIAGAAPLTDVPSIRALSRAEAASALPVKLSGVVVWRGIQNFVLHDGMAGIWVDFRRAKADGFWKDGFPNPRGWLPGCRVEIEGLTDPGGFAPIVVITGFRAMGASPLPDPRRVPVGQLLSGAEDAQYIEIEGVVRKYTKATPASPRPNGFFMMVDGQPCPVVFHNSIHLRSDTYVDARVKVRGILAPIFDLRAQMAGLKLNANGPEDITIVQPAPADPFAARRVSLDYLMPFAPDADLYHRKLVSGVVTFVVPGRLFFLWDGKNSVRVADIAADVKPGDTVDVAGFIDTTRLPAALVDAAVRVTGNGPVPPHQPATAAEILNPKLRNPWKLAAETDADGRLVRLTGILRRVLVPDNNGYVTLVVETGDRLVRVLLPAPPAQAPALLNRWVTGSTLELSGACELEMVRADSAPWFSIQGFHLWLASPGDVRVVHSPSWWTARRIATALGITAAIALLLLLWSGALRRQVDKQTRVIIDKSRDEAANAERTRISRDLHDELGANLTHISILSFLAAKPGAAPDTARRHSLDAAAAARQTIRALDESLWYISPENDTLSSLCDYICRCAGEILAPADTTLKCTIDEAIPERFLPPQARHGLLLAVKEALHNVLKHAPGANLVRVSCAMDGDAVFAVRVDDNGPGFAATEATQPETTGTGHDSHKRRGHGLDNMRRRMEALGGDCLIDSHPGKGARITFRLPLEQTNARPATP